MYQPLMLMECLVCPASPLSVKTAPKLVYSTLFMRWLLHKLDIVGVREPIFRVPDQSPCCAASKRCDYHKARSELANAMFSLVSNFSPQGRGGVALIFSQRWTVMSPESLGPKVLFATLKHDIGGQIMAHVWHATGAWHEMTQGFILTVDFRKAYDTVTFEYLAFVLSLMQLPLSYIRLIVHVMASPRLYVVDGEVLHEVIHRPSSRIRQGDPLSPALFVLASSQIIIILKKSLPDIRVIMYVDDWLIYRPCNHSDAVVLVRSIVLKIQIIGHFCGLHMNVGKSQILLKTLPSEPFAGLGLRVVRAFKYFGVLLGHPQLL